MLIILCPMLYASLQPNGEAVANYRQSLVSWLLKAKFHGFRAVKPECTLGPYRHIGLHGTDEEITEIIIACREAVGLVLH